jgi:hypothetical protein
MFVQFVLDSVWKVYDAIHGKDHEKVTKIANVLKIDLPDNFIEMINKDPQTALNVILYKIQVIIGFYVEMASN